MNLHITSLSISSNTRFSSLMEEIKKEGLIPRGKHLSLSLSHSQNKRKLRRKEESRVDGRSGKIPFRVGKYGPLCSLFHEYFLCLVASLLSSVGSIDIDIWTKTSCALYEAVLAWNLPSCRNPLLLPRLWIGATRERVRGHLFSLSPIHREGRNSLGRRD